MSRNFNIVLVASMDEKTRGIGYNGNLIYRSKDDLKMFKELTTRVDNSNKINAVLMGRKTYESIGKQLPNRINLIVSTTLKDDSLLIFDTIEKAEQYCEKIDNIETLYVIGGKTLYDYYIDKNTFNAINLTIFKSEDEVLYDTTFPELNLDQYNVHELEFMNTFDRNTNKIVKMYHLIIYRKENMEEDNYLDLLREIYTKGDIKQTRNSITKSIFGRSLTFDMRDGKFPLLTTKRVFFKGVAKELLWFLSGNTDAKVLQKDNIHIWDGNSNRQFLDTVGLSHLEEGDCGAIYSHQWRRFGAEYKGCNYEYKDEGFDQINYCINEIKTNPSSRRIVLTGWNPCQLDQCCLPCCHVLYIFNVTDGYLSCQMTMRSSDTFLGLPFNIASTALLVYLLSHYCDIKPGKITLCLADCHIYTDHFDAVKQQLDRIPYDFPTFEIIGNKPEKIEDYKYEQFKLSNYKCHSTIKAPMIA